MSGAPWFQFYPRDWFLDTRDLSQGAKGVYIDLLAAMYAHGSPLPYDERDLCKLTGCATVRSLRPVLQELFDKEKLRVVDGHLRNGRTMEEIEKRTKKIADSAKGGKTKKSPVRAEYDGNTTGTQAVTRGGIVEKQTLNPKQPEPEPERKKDAVQKGTGAGADPVKAIFDLGVGILIEAGKKEPQARTLVGKWRKDVGDEKLAPILIAAKSKTDPAAYVFKAVGLAVGRGEGKPNPDADRMLSKARLKAFRENGDWDTAWGPRPDADALTPGAA